MEIFPELVPAVLLVLPFLVTLLALNFILFKPLVQYLEDRDAVSGKALAEADSFKSAANDKLAELEEQLAGARREIVEIRKHARGEAQGEEAKILAEARKAAEAEVDTAVARISKEKADASVTLRGTAKVLSGDIAAQVLGRSAKEA